MLENDTDSTITDLSAGVGLLRILSRHRDPRPSESRAMMLDDTIGAVRGMHNMLRRRPEGALSFINRTNGQVKSCMHVCMHCTVTSMYAWL